MFKKRERERVSLLTQIFTYFNLLFPYSVVKQRLVLFKQIVSDISDPGAEAAGLDTSQKYVLQNESSLWAEAHEPIMSGRTVQSIYQLFVIPFVNSWLFLCVKTTVRLVNSNRFRYLKTIYVHYSSNELDDK